MFVTANAGDLNVFIHIDLDGSGECCSGGSIRHSTWVETLKRCSPLIAIYLEISVKVFFFFFLNPGFKFY